MNLRNSLFVFFFLFSTGILFAQPPAQEELTEKGSPVLNSSSLTLFAGENGTTYYIDFETINTNLKELVLMNEFGEVLKREDLSKLPVNTIFELDLSTFGTGFYEVELRTFSGVLRKGFEVR
ncbi:MAG: hypothetical protein KDC34_11245 [Saprospiraceae bacterium]|nr:hypothetical protein [Saprospiraceae bacterium]